MNRRVDVLVAGGGPAGAATAALLARSGARVLIVERDRFPRDKVCGEFVSAEGCRVLDRLGVLRNLLDSGAWPMDAVRIVTQSGRRLDAELPPLPGGGRDAMGITRARLDHALLERAARDGAEVRERCRVVGPVFDGPRVTGLRVRDVGCSGSGEEVLASVVVAADGRRSVIARAVHRGPGDPVRTGPHSWFGLKTHLDDDGAGLGRRVELHLFPGGYAGLARVEGGRVNLCLLVTVDALRRCGGSPDRVLAERVLRNAGTRNLLGDGPATGPWHSIGPLRFGARRPSAGGVLFAGDAAGTIDPYCGEGMSNALGSAELAMPILLRAAHGGALTPDLAREYDVAWRRAFGPVTRRVRRLGRVLERPRLAGPALGLLARSGRALFPRLVASTRTG